MMIHRDIIKKRIFFLKDPISVYLDALLRVAIELEHF
jgi:hypothetical protein